MGAWVDEATEAVAETASGDGLAVTAWLQLQPRELYHFTFVRDDAGGNVWTLEIEGSTDGARVPSNPFQQLSLTAVETVVEFPVIGRRYVRVRGLGSGGDILAGDVFWTRDGGL